MKYNTLILLIFILIFVIILYLNLNDIKEHMLTHNLFDNVNALNMFTTETLNLNNMPLATPEGITSMNIYSDILGSKKIYAEQMCISDQINNTTCFKGDDVVSSINYYINFKQTLNHHMYLSDPLSGAFYINNNIYNTTMPNSSSPMIVPVDMSKGIYDNTTYAPSVQQWMYKSIIQYGTNTAGGANINIPIGHTVIWIQLLNDTRYYCLKVTIFNTVLYFGRGINIKNNICPDGSVSNANPYFFWMPIPVLLKPSNKIITVTVTPVANQYGTTGWFWLGGVATSTNPWNHITNYSLAYYYNLVPTGCVAVQPATVCTIQNSLSLLTASNILFLQVSTGDNTTPFILTANVYVLGYADKLLYMVVNNDETDTVFCELQMGDIVLEQFRDTYDNPFSRHFNTYANSKYVAARIRSVNLIKYAQQIPGNTNTDIFYVTIKIKNVSRYNYKYLYLSEIGTHDFLPALQ